MEETVGKHLTTGQIRELIDIDRSHGGIGEVVQKLITCLTAPDVIWVGEVEVDYGTRPAYQELNGVWFDWANERFGNMMPQLRELSEVKPLSTSGIVKHRYGYVHLNSNAADEQALAGIAKRRVVPATDLELMYFGKTFPEEQRKYSIVALRSFFRIDRSLCSAVLYESGSKRCMNLIFSTVGHPSWHGNDRFLVREDGE